MFYDKEHLIKYDKKEEIKTLYKNVINHLLL